MVDREKRKVCMCVCVYGGREKKKLEVKRGEGGEERGTGNHRYVQDGGWVA